MDQFYHFLYKKNALDLLYFQRDTNLYISCYISIIWSLKINISCFNVPLQGILGGAPTNPGSHSQWKLPGVLAQLANGPQGFAGHSLISSQPAPLATKPSRQKHCPSTHSALLTQSKLDLQSIFTSTCKIRK